MHGQWPGFLINLPSWAAFPRNRRVFVEQRFPANREEQKQKILTSSKIGLPPTKGWFRWKRQGWKNIPSTKIELSYNKIQRMSGLDDLARILFPGNKNHQKVFLAIFIELKYAPGKFLPTLLPLCDKHGFSPRMLETVRSKMRRMGIIDHVSRFSKKTGYREGWIFSQRFSQSLVTLIESIKISQMRNSTTQELKDKNLFSYLWNMILT